MKTSIKQLLQLNEESNGLLGLILNIELIFFSSPFDVFSEINPMQKVPAIVDGRFKLFER